MPEFDPKKPARAYDNLNEERFFDWNPEDAEHCRQTARPYARKGWDELIEYEGLELLGWYPF